MPNLPIVSANKFIRVLKKKGFILDRIHGSHYIFIREKDKLTISVPVHKGHDLGRGLTRAILKDAQISEAEFFDLL